jgi:DNA-binding transcriptional regulator YiaG
MSRNLSFREALGHRVGALEESHEPFIFPELGRMTGFVLVAAAIAQPVEVARTLRRLGLSLRKAHEALDQLASMQSVVARLGPGEPAEVIAQLKAIGVNATPIVPPSPDVRTIRQTLGVSQAEFATRFGLELDTLRNWEQGRNQPDAPARLLLKIIELRPEVVDAVLAGGETPPAWAPVGKLRPATPPA